MLITLQGILLLQLPTKASQTKFVNVSFPNYLNGILFGLVRTQPHLSIYFTHSSQSLAPQCPHLTLYFFIPPPLAMLPPTRTPSLFIHARQAASPQTIVLSSSWARPRLASWTRSTITGFKVMHLWGKHSHHGSSELWLCWFASGWKCLGHVSWKAHMQWAGRGCGHCFPFKHFI